jgi:hypothetical protein
VADLDHEDLDHENERRNCWDKTSIHLSVKFLGRGEKGVRSIHGLQGGLWRGLRMVEEATR